MARMAGSAVCIGSAAYLGFKTIAGLSHASEQLHSGLDKRNRRQPPGEGAHGHLFGKRYFLNKDGLYIHFRCWEPAVPNGHVVVIVHGVGEHIGRYDGVAAALNSAGFLVYGSDHQGHGGSEGDRLHAGSIWDYVDDVIRLRTELAAPCDGAPPGQKVFILGHSMGGLISILSVMKSPELWDGCVFSAPAIIPDPAVATPMMKFLAAKLGSALPKIELDKLDTMGVARSETVVMQYKLDPLNNHRGLTTRIAANLLAGMDYAQNNMHKFFKPFLILHGTGDVLCMLDGSRKFAEVAASEDKTKIEYDGWYHELFNEVEDDCKLESDPQTGITTNLAVRDTVAWFVTHAGEPVRPQSRL